jgi:hypothetical protein
MYASKDYSQALNFGQSVFIGVGVSHNEVFYYYSELLAEKCMIFKGSLLYTLTPA